MSPLPAAPATDAEPDRLRLAIALLEGQRALLGDAVAQLALTPLRQRLASLENTPQLRRAQVTVLFVDIVESTALAGQMDAEDVLTVFSGFLQRAAACVQARGGRVLRFTGDGLKAAFGTQGAHEDDAVQAVQAGLDMLAAGRQEAERLRALTGLQGLALRVGVHTGEVAFGAGHEAEDTLSGDAVNVAARMEQSAPPGALRISADTWAQVRGRFVAEAQPPLQLKGLAQPVHTWLVRAPVATASAGAERGVEGLQVAMVGRGAELARLQQAWTDARSGGLQALTLVGDAGLGKSRLLREALAGVQADGTLLQARAQPRDGLRSWGLLRQMLMAHCRIADSDSAEAARAKLLSGLRPAFAAAGNDADTDLQAALIGQLIGLDFSDRPLLRGLDARALRDRALAAWLAWLAGLARQRPGLALVIEDLHSADEASLDALAHLMSRGRNLPLVLLMSTRPELLERRPAWCLADTAPHTARLTLAALPAADSDTLAAALLPGLQPLPPALRTLLTTRAEGNPYYMEELVRRLLDEGIVQREHTPWQFDAARLGRLKLPTTLVGLLQARLDALPAAERAGAQHASIVGPVFWDAALAQIDPGAVPTLGALQQRSWVQAQAPSAFEGTAEHRFDHHLLHQVTYGTVLKNERRRGHAAVARWLAERTSDRGPEFLAITGEHAERAGDEALAASCYERAATAARERYANALAIDCLQRALRLVRRDEFMRRLDMLQSLRDTADLVGQRELQAQALDALQAVLDEQPSPHHQAELMMSRAMLADRQGQHDTAFAHATAALALAEAIDDDDVAALAHAELCWLHGARGEHAAATAHQQAGQARAERVRDTQPVRELQLLLMAGLVALQADKLGEAGTLLNRALERCAPEGGRLHRRLQLGVLEGLCEQAKALGDWGRAAALGQELLQASRDMGDPMRQGAAHHNAARVALERQAPALALAAAATALAHAQACGNLFFQAYAHGAAGDAHALQGDARAARAAYQQAREVLASLDAGGPRVAEMDVMVARQDLALGDTGAARAGAERWAAAQGPEDTGSVGSPITASDHGFAAHWAAFEVWRALGDPRAAGLLTRLQGIVQRVCERRAGSPEEALALQERIPLFRTILAATGGLTTSAAAS